MKQSLCFPWLLQSPGSGFGVRRRGLIEPMSPGSPNLQPEGLMCFILGLGFKGLGSIGFRV